MTRGNQTKGLSAGYRPSAAQAASLVGIAERPVTGRYHLLSASGAVLAVCDKLEPLLKNIDQKPGATILRGGVVVWPVEGLKR